MRHRLLDHDFTHLCVGVACGRVACGGLLTLLPPSGWLAGRSGIRISPPSAVSRTVVSGKTCNVGGVVCDDVRHVFVMICDTASSIMILHTSVLVWLAVVWLVEGS